jgi:hypothetical protein
MTRKAFLYLPAKTAMQSGTANTARWVLEFRPQDKKSIDPVMGWISSADTTRQLKLYFDSQEDAQRYAAENGIAVELRQPHQRKTKPKSYAANFATNRRNYSDVAAGN